jgi:DNA-directed RNA polymerase specialized sigma24 family protein
MPQIDQQIVLRYLAGWSLREIGESLGIGNRVYLKFDKIKDQLRRTLAG